MIQLLILSFIATTCLAVPNIIRPCQFTDYKCIGDNLSANSRCNKNVRGSLPPAYTVQSFRFETPFFNSSFIDKNLIVRNQDKCFVSEFLMSCGDDAWFVSTSALRAKLTFYNRYAEKTKGCSFDLKTDTAILGLDCPQLDLESERTVIQHSSLKEDTSYAYHIRGTYPLIRLTVSLANANNLNLCSAFVFADVTALPNFHVDPKDKKTANYLAKDFTMLNIYERETFFYRGPSLARNFINNYICNFGCT